MENAIQEFSVIKHKDALGDPLILLVEEIGWFSADNPNGFSARDTLGQLHVYTMDCLKHMEVIEK